MAVSCSWGCPYFTNCCKSTGHAVLAHPAFAAPVRISPVLLFGSSSGCWADAVIYPNYGGRFTYSQQLCADLAATARALGAKSPILPVPVGGMTVERCPKWSTFTAPTPCCSSAAACSRRGCAVGAQSGVCRTVADS
ncbi:MAG: hypothetical protein R3A44_41810 [Caldilineaceae bacterium]